MVNGLVFSFAEPSAILFRSSYYELTGYPLDFLERYQKALEGVNAATVLRPRSARSTPTGSWPSWWARRRSSRSRSRAWAWPSSARTSASRRRPRRWRPARPAPQALARGQALLARAAGLAGGSAAWGAIKSVSMKRDEVITMQGQSMAMTSVMHWRMPDRYVATRKLAMGEIAQGFDGTSGWMAGMGQVRDEPKVGEELRKQYERSFFRLFAEPGAYQVQALDEPRTVDGVTCSVALVKSETTRDWLLYFAPDGALARMEYLGEGMGGGPARIAEIYGDWKPVGDVRYPHSEKTLMDDKPVMEAKVTSLELNPTLADELFQKPAAK